MDVAIKYGADAVMDLSTGGDIKKMRRLILKNSTVPVGTVPIYEIAIMAAKKRGHISRIRAQDIIDVLEAQALDGVDFFTIHSGITQGVIERLKKQKRLISIVSRGGSFIAEWMIVNKKENPLRTPPSIKETITPAAIIPPKIAGIAARRFMSKIIANRHALHTPDPGKGIAVKMKRKIAP